MVTETYGAFVMAVDRVARRLRRVAAALDDAGIRYAVIGGNAVAAWVARADPSATRTTKDVALLVRRDDDQEIARVMLALGFTRHDLRRMVLFTDPDEPSKRGGVHIVLADELVRSNYVCPAPSVAEAVRDPEGFAVLDLPALVRMKLTSFRDIDRVHIADLLSVGVIDTTVRNSLPGELVSRLEAVEQSIET